MSFRYWVFCGNKDQKPTWLYMGKMAIVHNEYYLKERIYAKKSDRSLSGRIPWNQPPEIISDCFNRHNCHSAPTYQYLLVSPCSEEYHL